MEFSYKPDFDKTLKRFEAFWNNDVADRPPVNISFPKEKRLPGPPPKQYPDMNARWMDVEYRAEADAVNAANTEYYADSLPVVWPNMGPEVFSAWCGCDYNFTEHTAWSSPCVLDWERDAPRVRLDMEHPLFKLTEKYTRLLLEYGRDKFIVGLTDFHPGGDHLAALRDPQELAVDLVECPEEVRAMLASSQKEFFRAYDYFYRILSEAGQPCTTWTPAICYGKYYLPSNDFSCMVSAKMYEEFFLDGIRSECRFYDYSLYHLDGPGALRHLPAILSIPELNAVQWVPTAGKGCYADWVPIYQQIQKAGKAVQLKCDVSELGQVFETLRPEGVWFANLSGVDSRDTAEKVLERIAHWR